jgi:hypothetical protein
MHVTFAPKGILQIDDARIIYRNFAGAPSKFNRDGDRNFAVIIEDEETCEALINDLNEYGVGWNVKVKPPRDEDESPFMTLMVKIRFNDRGPNVYLRTGDKMTRLDEESIECLDNVDIASVDLDIRPYDDEINGKPFRAAYLQSMCVTQDITDRFAAKYAEEN